MRVCVDGRLIDKFQNTGISRYTEFLIEYYINAYGDKNITIVTNDINFKKNNCVIVFTKLKPYNIFHFLRFSDFIRSLKIDLLHVPFYSALSNKNENIKVIVTVHDLMYRLVDGFFGKNKIIRLFKLYYFDFIVKKSLDNSDLIISVSQSTKNDVLAEFGFNSIHIPEDSNIQSFFDFSILQKLNLSKKGYFFYCGNNRPHKNIDFVRELFKNNLDLPPLVLAGNGHQSASNIIAIGIVSEEELYALYKYAIAFIFPSKYEGFGLPVLESLRLETFVIASKIPAFLEFKSKNIFYFELNNKDEFLMAIDKSKTQSFIKEESFLDYYDKSRIYKLNDQMLKDYIE